MAAETLIRPREEAALFNPAFLAVLLRNAAREHTGRSGRPLTIPAAYVIAPLALHAPTREALPTMVTSPMAAWVQRHPALLADLATRARALRPLVSAACVLGLRHGVLLAEEGGMVAG